MKTANSSKLKVKPDDWRLNQQLAGGGFLLDLGICCLQSALYTLGKRPVSLTAKFSPNTRPDYFKTGEESITWQMQFEGGAVAECSCSYSEEAKFYPVKLSAAGGV